MGMNVNNGRFILPNWKDRINYNPEVKPQELTAERLEPGNSGGGINVRPRPYNGPAPNIQDILNNLDNPDIPKFS